MDTSVTINKFTYAEVPMHMMLSIGDMHRNSIQHHALTKDTYIYHVKFIFYCMFLFFQFQPVFSTY